MPTTDHKLRVFLCHASQDKPIVRGLYQRLLAEGWIDPWLDEEKLLPGQDWDMEIEKAVEASDAVIVCLSDSSVKKEGYIQKELRFALNVALEKPEEAIFIIPLRLDQCFVPRTIRSIQYIDYFPNDKREKSYKRLFQSLVKRANHIGINENGRCYKCDEPILSIHSRGTCLYCDTPYHKECWEDNHGCYKFGCAGNLQVDLFLSA
jgi:hypothetical protein